MGFCEIKDPPEFKTQVEKWDRDTMADGEQMGVVIEEIFNNTVHNYKAMRKKGHGYTLSVRLEHCGPIYPDCADRGADNGGQPHTGKGDCR